jgi:ABC-2 type transport system permease protein
MNPMIKKELNQRMRERRGWVLPSLYLIALGAVVTFAYFLIAGMPTWQFRPIEGSSLGVGLFLTVAYAQLSLLLLLVPVFSAGAITIEKEQRTLASLLTSLLTAGEIWRGKFVASLLFIVLLLITGLPVLSVAFAFGGIGPWEVTIATLTTLIVVASLSAVGLYWSSIFRRSVYSTGVSYASVIVVTVVTAITFFILQEMNKWRTWNDTPLPVKLIIELNPYFFLTAGFAPLRNLYPEWVTSAILFTALALIAALLGVRNLRRSGEMA